MNLSRSIVLFVYAVALVACSVEHVSDVRIRPVEPSRAKFGETHAVTVSTTSRSVLVPTGAKNASEIEDLEKTEIAKACALGEPFEVRDLMVGTPQNLVFSGSRAGGDGTGVTYFIRCPKLEPPDNATDTAEAPVGPITRRL